MGKKVFVILLVLSSFSAMSQTKVKQTAGHDALGEFAPEFAHLNDNVLFGEVWSRNDLLSLRDRSMITVTALVSQGLTDSSLLHHLQFAKKNGITRTEIAEIITHVAFYAGWPKAWAAFNLAKTVWNEESSDNDAKNEFQKEMIFPIGEPNTAFEKYFTGKSYLAKVSDEQVRVSNVTFEPGCRNNWHIHNADKGGRSNAYRRCRTRLVSTRRHAAARNPPRYGYPHSGRRKTLARGCKRQLVRPPCL